MCFNAKCYIRRLVDVAAVVVVVEKLLLAGFFLRNVKMRRLTKDVIALIPMHGTKTLAGQLPHLGVLDVPGSYNAT